MSENKELSETLDSFGKLTKNKTHTFPSGSYLREDPYNTYDPYLHIQKVKCPWCQTISHLRVQDIGLYAHCPSCGGYLYG